MGKLPTRLVLAAYNGNAPTEENYAPQPDRSGLNGAFYIGPANELGYYSTGAKEHSAIRKFNAENTSHTKVALFRDLFTLACEQNGVPLGAQSFVLPSATVLAKHAKKKVAKVMPPLKKPSAFGLWRRWIGAKYKKGDWKKVSNQEYWVEQAAGRSGGGQVEQAAAAALVSTTATALLELMLQRTLLASLVYRRVPAGPRRKGALLTGTPPQLNRLIRKPAARVDALCGSP